MQLLKRVFSPYPRSWRVHKLALTTGVFVGFFIAYFQPFGLHELVYSSKLFLLLGYGAVTTACLYLFSGGLPLLFPSLFRESSWNVLRQILFLLALVLTQLENKNEQNTDIELFTISFFTFGSTLLFF